MYIRSIVVNIPIVLLLVASSIPLVAGDSDVLTAKDDSHESVINGGLIDNIDIYCRGPYLFQIIIRECVFTVSFLNENNVRIKLKLEVNVTTPDGTLLFYPGAPFYAALDPGHEGNMQYWTFKDFRKVGHLFGFFNINVKFCVRDDGSERKEVFYGFIFGISAVILNPKGKVVI